LPDTASHTEEARNPDGPSATEEAIERSRTPTTEGESAKRRCTIDEAYDPSVVDVEVLDIISLRTIYGRLIHSLDHG